MSSTPMIGGIGSKMDANTGQTVANSINQFSFKLVKVFASRHKDDSKNMCFSPFEVFNSLVMLLVGAKGVSEAQLEDMLCLRGFNCKQKYDELIDLREWIIKNNHDIMVYGSTIYIDNRVEIQPDYLEKLRQIFDIKPKRIDFQQSEQAVAIINKDAYQLTDGAIDGVIGMRDIKDDANIRLIISNAVFFRGYWRMQFGDVRKDDFHYSKGTKNAKVDMMSHVGQHRHLYCDDLKAQAVSIAYASSEIRMVIILPENRESEAIYLVDLLNVDRFVALFKELQARPKSLTELTIPRFALDAHKVSLQKSVKQMGAKSIYEHDMAQLGGICANDRLHLTKLVHKAFILVDERGSHAASAQSQEESRFMKNMNESDTEDESSSDNPSPVSTFKANHPFVFVILDKDTSVVCFMGLFADPNDVLEVVHEKDLTREQIQELLAENDIAPTPDAISSSFSSSNT